jgi:small subunit ribosomal protein S3
MASEQQFIEDGMQRTRIDEFFEEELGRAGYGGMELAKTPMGTQIVLQAEKPGMVIGKGGKNIRKVTSELEERFDLEDPQIDVQEVEEPDLNAQIVADRLGNALERGWYFRKAGHTTVDRIMDAGALGAEIILAGKVTGARSRVEKFNRGYIKHNGEPAEDIVDRGDGVAVMKLGTIGVTVRIIPPGSDLPDDFRIREDVDVSALVPEDVEGDDVDALLAGDEPEPAEGDPDAEAAAEAEGTETSAEADTPAAAAEVAEEEIVEEGVESETGAAPTSPASTAEGSAEEELDALDAAVETDLDEETTAEAEELVDEMDAAEADATAADEAADTAGSSADLTAIDGVGEAKAAALREAGFSTLDDVRAASEADLAEAEGVGEAFAERITDGVAALDAEGETGGGNEGGGA